MTLTYSEACAYTAGLIDGEGSFPIRSDTKKHWGGSVRVVNTAIELLYPLQEWFGGRISLMIPSKSSPLKSTRQAFLWCATGSTARRCVTAIFPYLRHEEKRARASALLSGDEGSQRYNKYGDGKTIQLRQLKNKPFKV